MKEYKLTINGNDYNVAVNDVNNGAANVVVNGVAYRVGIDHVEAGPRTPKSVEISRATYQSPPPAVHAKVHTAPSATANASPLKSPLPGIILGVRVGEGDTVKEGQTVMILEAMKMENNIDAHKSGVVRKISKQQGDPVLEGDELLIIE